MEHNNGNPEAAKNGYPRKFENFGSLQQEEQQRILQEIGEKPFSIENTIKDKEEELNRLREDLENPPNESKRIQLEAQIAQLQEEITTLKEEKIQAIKDFMDLYLTKDPNNKATPLADIIRNTYIQELLKRAFIRVHFNVDEKNADSLYKLIQAASLIDAGEQSLRSSYEDTISAELRQVLDNMQRLIGTGELITVLTEMQHTITDENLRDFIAEYVEELQEEGRSLEMDGKREEIGEFNDKVAYPLFDLIEKIREYGGLSNAPDTKEKVIEKLLAKVLQLITTETPISLRVDFDEIKAYLLGIDPNVPDDEKAFLQRIRGEMGVENILTKVERDYINAKEDFSALWQERRIRALGRLYGRFANLAGAILDWRSLEPFSEGFVGDYAKYLVKPTAYKTFSQKGYNYFFRVSVRDFYENRIKEVFANFTSELENFGEERKGIVAQQESIFTNAVSRFITELGRNIRIGLEGNIIKDPFSSKQDILQTTGQIESYFTNLLIILNTKYESDVAFTSIVGLNHGPAGSFSPEKMISVLRTVGKDRYIRRYATENAEYMPLLNHLAGTILGHFKNHLAIMNRRDMGPFQFDFTQREYHIRTIRELTFQQINALETAAMQNPQGTERALLSKIGYDFKLLEQIQASGNNQGYIEKRIEMRNKAQSTVFGFVFSMYKIVGVTGEWGNLTSLIESSYKSGKERGIVEAFSPRASTNTQDASYFIPHFIGQQPKKIFGVNELGKPRTEEEFFADPTVPKFKKTFYRTFRFLFEGHRPYITSQRADRMGRLAPDTDPEEKITMNEIIHEGEDAESLLLEGIAPVYHLNVALESIWNQMSRSDDSFSLPIWKGIKNWAAIQNKRRSQNGAPLLDAEKLKDALNIAASAKGYFADLIQDKTPWLLRYMGMGSFSWWIPKYIGQIESGLLKPKEKGLDWFWNYQKQNPPSFTAMSRAPARIIYRSGNGQETVQELFSDYKADVMKITIEQQVKGHMWRKMIDVAPSEVLTNLSLLSKEVSQWRATGLYARESGGYERINTKALTGYELYFSPQEVFEDALEREMAARNITDENEKNTLKDKLRSIRASKRFVIEGFANKKTLETLEKVAFFWHTLKAEVERIQTEKGVCLSEYEIKTMVESILGQAELRNKLRIEENMGKFGSKEALLQEVVSADDILYVYFNPETGETVMDPSERTMLERNNVVDSHIAATRDIVAQTLKKLLFNGEKGEDGLITYLRNLNENHTQFDLQKSGMRGVDLILGENGFYTGVARWWDRKFTETDTVFTAHINRDRYMMGLSSGERPTDEESKNDHGFVDYWESLHKSYESHKELRNIMEVSKKVVEGDMTLKQAVEWISKATDHYKRFGRKDLQTKRAFFLLKFLLQQTLADTRTRAPILFDVMPNFLDKLTTPTESEKLNKANITIGATKYDEHAAYSKPAEVRRAIDFAVQENLIKPNKTEGPYNRYALEEQLGISLYGEGIKEDIPNSYIYGFGALFGSILNEVYSAGKKEIETTFQIGGKK